MKLSGRNLKRRLYGAVTSLTGKVTRARYFRGHGVHSPFVYGLVRQVFMSRRFRTDERTLYDMLRRLGLSHRRARQLQNLADYCGYRSFGTDRAAECDLAIVTRTCDSAAIPLLAAEAAASGTTLAILCPYDSRERQRQCAAAVAAHRSTSVDNRGYLLLFNNHLPKQHFKL